MLETAKRISRKLWGNKPITTNTSLPESSGIVVHALHKSATTFLYKFFVDLSTRANVPIFSIHSDPPDNQVPATRTESFILCPVRDLNVDSFKFSSVNHLQHIVQVRDPRDILVSEYFSLGWRHTDQNWTDEAKARRAEIQATSIDQFVLTESQTGKPPLSERLQPLLRVDAAANVTLVKYETMVTDFPKWLSSVIESCRFTNSENLIFSLAEKYNAEFCADKDPSGHKRIVQPGDHRNKLTAATIELLNQKFAKFLEHLGYEL